MKTRAHPRRLARRLVLQALYQWQLTGDTLTELLEQFQQAELYPNADSEYFTEMLTGIVKTHAELDALIAPYLDRALHELDLIEHALLWLGCYELSQRLDVPYKVAINEALELCKGFGSVEGYKFVNAILDSLARQLRSTEINCAEH